MTHHSAIGPASALAPQYANIPAISEILFIIDRAAADLTTIAGLITRLELSQAELTQDSVDYLCTGAMELAADIAEGANRLAVHVPAERIPRTPIVQRFESIVCRITDISRSLVVIMKIAGDTLNNSHMVTGFPAWFVENIHREIDDLRAAVDQIPTEDDQ